MPVGSLSFCPRVVWAGHTLDFGFPCAPWLPSSLGIGVYGGTTAAGIPSVLEYRREQLLDVTLRCFESEYAAVDEWLSWAQSTTDARFVFQLDKNDPASAHTCWLKLPAMIQPVSFGRSTLHVGLFETTIQLRDVDGRVFDYRITNL